jgi:hypothetical protein
MVFNTAEFYQAMNTAELGISLKEVDEEHRAPVDAGSSLIRSAVLANVLPSEMQLLALLAQEPFSASQFTENICCNATECIQKICCFLRLHSS